MTEDKCFKCQKKVLPAIKCKCGNISCLRHRFEAHNCSFDHKAFDLKNLAKNMVKLEDTRVEKI